MMLSFLSVKDWFRFSVPACLLAAGLVFLCWGMPSVVLGAAPGPPAVALPAGLMTAPDPGPSAAPEVFFLTHPAPSPDGQTVVFSFEGDLWQVPVSGGMAVRLTGMPGEETHPRFSPDGRWLAFSAELDGNTSVYLKPVAGGDVRRLTWHDGSNLVNSWSWDSGQVRFSSDRYNYIDAWEVSITGDTPRRLMNSHFFNLPHDVAQHPETGDFFFTDTWESFRFYERKRYRGPFNPVIRSYNPETDVFAEHTVHDGKNMWPTIDQNGVVYYTSDEANGEYNLFRLTENGPEQLTHFDRSVKFPQVSADGSVVVFEKDYQLWAYDVAAAEARLIPVLLGRTPTLGLPVSFEVAGNITAFDVSPDGKKLAFIARGELFVSDAEGRFVRQMPTLRGERAGEVIWLSNDELLYTQTLGGYFNLFRMRATGDGPEMMLTELPQQHRNLRLSPDAQSVAYFRGRTEVMLFNPARNDSRLLLEDELWTFRNSSLRWSPDSRWIAFNAYRFFERDIIVHQPESGQTLNLTRTGVTENTPFWSADGQFIYFSTDRIQPVYPRGNTAANIWRMALSPQTPPLRLDRFDALFTESSSDETEVRVSIQTERLHERWEQITRHSGNQSGPFVLVEGEKHTVIYGSAHDGTGFHLWKTVLEPFKSPETTKIEGTRNTAPDIISAGGSHFLLVSGNIHKLDLNRNNTERIRIEHRFSRNLMDEFAQMFHETWANLEENFYEESFHGQDWHALRDYYAQFLPYLNSRANLRRLTNDMLGELNSSHMGFNSRGDEENVFLNARTLATGILFRNDDPFVVDRILHGSNADLAGLQAVLQPGDVLRAVDGTRVNTEGNRERYFSVADAGSSREVELVFARGRAEFPVRVQTQTSGSLQNLFYDEWERSRQHKVDEITGERVAYIHMRNMGGGSLQHFQQELARQFVHRDALILDLRYNRGGNVHDDVIQALSRQPYLNWQFRGGAMAGQPNFAPAGKPIVVLINEQSLSDAEMTTAGLRELGLGTIIGMPTYRWIIFTTAMGLVDGSSHRLPAWGVFDFEGNNLELTGVEPHIEVRNTFHDLLHGRDPQLERAFEYLRGQGIPIAD